MDAHTAVRRPDDEGWEEAAARRRRRALLLTAAALLLAVVPAWWVGSGRIGDDVTVRRAGDLSCTGTRVGWSPVPSDGRRAPLVWMREGMRCRMPVRVVNASGSTVGVEQIVLPFMGPVGGTGVRSGELLGSPVAADSEIDAVAVVDREIRPGEEWRFDVELLFRESGCSSPDSTTWIRGLPTVTITSRGLRHDVPGPAISFRGTADSSCDT